ncbi:hypothetical protein M885DRAFT_454725 [Pelagophyceae sp. CCMP2097]|nr:hypothetical protein M885DRAFT_454725 [Pelagophyceae sp. CCMP2097]
MDGASQSSDADALGGGAAAAADGSAATPRAGGGSSARLRSDSAGQISETRTALRANIERARSRSRSGSGGSSREERERARLKRAERRAKFYRTSELVPSDGGDGGAAARSGRRRRKLRSSGSSIISYPYLFDAAAKQRLLRFESRHAMRKGAINEYRRAQETGERQAPYFIIAVRREHLVQDALKKLVGARDENLRMQLKVAFKDEEGVDEGGVANEFMQIATRQLLSPDYGMFRGDADSNHSLWFARDSFESQLEFELVGILLGVAIYNSIIVDAPFAPALWKKLVGEPLSLADLDDAFPTVSRSLRAILAFAQECGSDAAFDAAFGDLCFEASYVAYGAPVSVALEPGGEARKVTRASAHAYVDAYVDWALGSGVATQFAAFQRGFFKVIGGDVWRLLSAADLELLVRGSPTLDFEELEQAATYEDGYDEDSATVAHFWTVVHELDDGGRRRLLKFVTGSDRAPINGLGASRFVVSRTGAIDQLPSSHTCFQHLVLPDYKSLDVMRTKLLIAISESSEGFGLR